MLRIIFAMFHANRVSQRKHLIFILLLHFCITSTINALPRHRSDLDLEDAPSTEWVNESPCGMNPIDIFLENLVERMGDTGRARSNLFPRNAELEAGAPNAGLLRTFTLLHAVSPKDYRKLMYGISLWNRCQTKQAEIIRKARFSDQSHRNNQSPKKPNYSRQT
ncbi:unnamed protein product [Calicophoron daubneyi]|uniref:Uncharacterized protein n=1 Tax=Calicophoron daubneyi TaxID=300641 RepID=A0AAV2TQ24_CALDB